MVWQGENFGIALKELAKEIEPDRPALIYGEEIISWGNFDSLTDRIAAGLIGLGMRPGDVAGQMLRNTPDYLLAYFGCIKAGITPVNINYHYKGRELADIFIRFGLKAIFLEQDFADVVATIAPQGMTVVDTGSTDWLALQGTVIPKDYVPHQDPKALFFTATGGTTGMPKAVMWPFEAAWQAFGVSVWQRGPGEQPFLAGSLEEHVAEAARIGPNHPASSSPLLVLSPLMHGAGQFSSVIHLLKGGSLAILPAIKFDPIVTIREIERLQARNIFIVGDAFALPLADALDVYPEAAASIASLRTVTSSGALFSESNKTRLLAHNPQMAIIDALGSSESSGTAIVVTTVDGSTGGGKFQALPGRETKLFDQSLQEILPGESGVGIVARSGPLPLGYLGEDEKNAKTFPEIAGQRYLMTGDQACWGEDGTLQFIGRDNMCINTGGEKVYPEEVEVVLQDHPKVRDARVVSLPDARFGRKVVAVVQVTGTKVDIGEELDFHARASLAGYKIPRSYFFTDQSLRLNNGKPDYKGAQAIADKG